MSTIIPQYLKIERQDGTTVEVPDVTLIVWRKALEFETDPRSQGMQMTRISASATAKRMLGLPKGWRKKRVLETVTDLLNQLETAKESRCGGHNYME